MPNRGERTKGVIKALEDLGIKVIYQEIPDNVNSDASQGTQCMLLLMLQILHLIIVNFINPKLIS